MKRKARGPVPLGRALKSYIERSGMGERLEQASVLTDWDERVGEAIAAVTRPVRISRGVLHVAVRSSAWLMELKMMQREILDRINAGRAVGRIHGLRFSLDDGRGHSAAKR